MEFYLVDWGILDGGYYIILQPWDRLERNIEGGADD